MSAKNYRLIEPFLNWSSILVYVAIFSTMFQRYLAQKKEFPVYDSVSINPYLIFLLGGALGFRVCRRVRKQGSNFDWVIDMVFVLGLVAYTVAHFFNVFHYIDPVH